MPNNQYQSKAEALEHFKYVHGSWIPETLKTDRPAVKFAWSTYVDGLVKSGLIDPKKSYGWSNPFEKVSK